ncbi:MAG: hypothetical protein IKK03_04020 [Lachnospiraceae bacterium]|nr:hypothetical protein [Lachnospiraceae bacterium]
MKKKSVKKVLALLLAATTLTACGQTPASSTESSVETGSVGTETVDASEASSEVAIDKDKLPTISLYPSSASLTSGLVTGHKSDYFAENGFQLEVWAYSAEKTNAILTSGDLPDIMYVQKGEQLDTLIETDAIICLDDYLDQLPHLYTNQYMEGALDLVRETRSAGTGKLYSLPITVGETASTVALVDSTDRNAVKLRWDVYEEIGAPEIKDYWDLIDVMEEMLKAHPQEEDGTKCYGTILDNGMDTQFFGAMTLWYQWQGYNTNYLQFMLEADYVNGEFSSILTKDSLYYEGLKWYNEVYRRGLMDPDSINTDRSTQATKIDNGFAMVPSGTLPGWSPIYFEYLIPGTNIYYDDVREVSTSKWNLVINKDTEHLEECLKLIDMWVNPDAYLRIKYGPDGDIWYSDGENAYLTDEYIAWLEAGNSINGFPMSDGTEWSMWNTNFSLQNAAPTSYGDGKGGSRPVTITYWEEQMEIAAASETFAQWRETTGYNSWREWIDTEGVHYTNSPVDAYVNALTNPDDGMKLTISTLKDVVVPASWQMVYAETEADFDAIWDKMVKDCEGLGAQDVIDWKLADIEAAKKLAK